MLATLSQQSVAIGQIVIADGGHDAETLVMSFADRLPVIWLDCPTPGQIAQRNFALAKLDPATEVVIYLDDDIQLEPDAIEKLVACWNSREDPPAGITLNITNAPKQQDNFFRHLFFMQTVPLGTVLTSGYNTPMAGLRENLRSQWLIGGATAWRKDILLAHLNRPIPSRWAITEDLMFSYGLHKKGLALYGCADARVQHVDDTIAETFKVGQFRGNNATLWRYLFVAENAELSKARFFWMMIGQTAVRLALGLTGKPWHLGYAAGHLKGMALSLYALVSGADVRRMLK
jgi:glycosyltransferase involved in cell wall biosynthesis